MTGITIEKDMVEEETMSNLPCRFPAPSKFAAQVVRFGVQFPVTLQMVCPGTMSTRPPFHNAGRPHLQSTAGWEGDTMVEVR